MHTILFGLKRAFQASLSIARGWLPPGGLTPARLDMLRAIRLGEGARTNPTELARKLGVRGPTVSRMLGALEKLGYVVRERCVGDRRRVLVRLTGKGQRAIRRIGRDVIDRGIPRLAFDTCWGRLNPNDCFLADDAVSTWLDRIRATFSDSASLYYAWHPDD